MGRRVGAFLQRINDLTEVVESHVIGGDHDKMIKVIVPDRVTYRKFFGEQLGEVPKVPRLCDRA